MNEETDNNEKLDAAIPDQQKQIATSGIKKELSKAAKRRSLRKYAGEQWGNAQEQLSEFVKTRARQALIQAARSAAIAAWSWVTAAVGPYAGVIIIALFLILIVAMPAYGEYIKYHSGKGGNQSPNYPSAYASDSKSKLALADLANLFGEKYIISQNPESFYFCQADPRFNNDKLEGSWPSGSNYLKQKGCALTSITMVLRYYGVDNITPVEFANYWASQNGKDLSIAGDMSAPFNHFLKANSLREKTAKRYYGSPSAKTIKSYINQGIPLVTQGMGICGSSSQHWVVIIGISKDERSVIISDPAGGWRSSPARYCKMSDTNIKSYIIYQ